MPNKKHFKKQNILPKGLLHYKIRKLFKEKAGKQFSPKDVLKELKVQNSIEQVAAILERFIKHGFLVQGKPGLYTIKKQERQKKRTKNFEGIVDMTRTGSAYIICDALQYDVHISRKFMNTALDGDKVSFELFYVKKGNKHDGKITKIIKRANDQFMGTYKNYGNYAIVYIDRTKRDFEVFLDSKHTLDAQNGDKVVVEITEWRGKRNLVPWGKIIQSFGPGEDHDMEMKAILVNNGFKIDFPQNVLEEAELLKAIITDKEIAARKDFRELFTITIDPFNAKDFDDALSLRKMANGHYEVGIHIADVTHFVRSGTALDEEAFDRSTSVYLVDRVCPMLPEKLSNELCSLRPNEDKYTFSAVFEFDQQLNIIKEWFGKSLIHSDRRFTYEEVQEILDVGAGEYVEELQTLNRIAKKLRADKFKNGAISFESDEVTFKLDEDGSPIEIYAKERVDAHMLVEDFMLLANKKVAGYITGKSSGNVIPFVYRIHDLPDPDKLKDFAAFAGDLGFAMNISSPEHIAASFNKLNEAAKKDDTLKILESLALRTMAKAVYSTDNIGHYGLGFDHYTHFTSPIRRYADVLVHRILFTNLSNGNQMKKANLESKCLYISGQERKAVDAERASIKYKLVEYIIDHIGEEFEGIITGIIEKGFFVLLEENKVEGLVSFSTMDEFYKMDQSKMKITGKDSGKIMRLGQKIRVKITDADLDKRQVEMELIEG